MGRNSAFIVQAVKDYKQSLGQFRLSIDKVLKQKHFRHFRQRVREQGSGQKGSIYVDLEHDL